jgi:HEAT repeat protein
LPLLGELLAEGTRAEKAAVLAALVCFANARAAAVLEGSGAPAGLEREWVDAYLACAHGMLAAGDRTGSERVFETVYESSERSLVRAAALIGLASAKRQDAVPMLVKALRAEDPGLRKTAARLLVEIPGEGVTLALARELGGLAPDTQVALLSTLAERGDRAAAEPVAQLVATGPEAVSIAALAALADVGTAESVPVLARAAGGSGEPSDVAAASLARLSAEGAEQQMLALVGTADPRTQAALIAVLTKRRSAEAVPVLLDLAVQADTRVRREACTALAELADAADLPRLLWVLERADDRRVRSAAANAVVAACRRFDDREEAVAVVLAALPGSDVPTAEALLGVLGRVGGETARAAVVAALDGELRDAAVRALCEWPDAGAADDLLGVARDAESAVHRVLALRAYVRVAGLPSDRPATETVRMLAEGMAAAERAEERRTVLSGIAQVPDSSALEYARGYAGDPELAAEAQSAVVRVALALSGARPAEAREALESVRDNAATLWLAEEAANALKAMAGCEDFITAWLAAGPYRREGTGGSGLFDVEFAPETGTDVAWRLCPGVTDPNRPWMVDLEHVFGGEDRAAYLRTRVFSPSQQNALLSIGSDDGIKAWLNGEQVLAVDKSRPLKRDEDQAEAVLREGWNDLLLKITQGGGDWAVCARFLAPDGQALEGLRASVE